MKTMFQCTHELSLFFEQRKLGVGVPDSQKPWAQEYANLLESFEALDAPVRDAIMSRYQSFVKKHGRFVSVSYSCRNCDAAVPHVAYIDIDHYSLRAACSADYDCLDEVLSWRP